MIERLLWACRAPEVLTLHLKRFQQDLSGRLRKIDGPVPFPGALDLSPYCDPEVTFSCTQTRAQQLP